MGMHDQLDAAERHGVSAETGSGHLLTMDGARWWRSGPRTSTDGDGSRRHRRLHRLRRGPDPAARASRRARLPGGDELRAGAHRPQGLHAHPHALRRHGRGLESDSGRAGRAAVAREVLFGQHHAGAYRGDHDQRRTPGGLSRGPDRFRSGRRCWSSHVRSSA